MIWNCAIKLELESSCPLSSSMACICLLILESKEERSFPRIRSISYLLMITVCYNNKLLSVNKIKNEGGYRINIFIYFLGCEDLGILLVSK